MFIGVINIIDFGVLTLHPAFLPNWVICLRRFTVDYIGFSKQTIIPSIKKETFISPFPMCMHFDVVVLALLFQLRIPVQFSFFFFYFLFFFTLCSHFFFSFIFISWRLITLQYCSGFCHTLTWISHGFTCVPHPDPPSRLPAHPIPLGLPSAPALSTCLMHPT